MKVIYLKHYYSSIQICNSAHLSSDFLIQRITDIISRQGLIVCTENDYDYAYKLFISSEWITVCASHWDEPSSARRRESADFSRELCVPCLSVSEYSFMDDSTVSIEYFDTKGNALDYVGLNVTKQCRKLPEADWSAILSEKFTTKQFHEILTCDYDSAESALRALSPCFGMECSRLLSNYKTNLPKEQMTELYFKLKSTYKRKPPTVKKAFNAIFGSALEPLGFVKPKLRQPYYIRMVGDEILHIIGINDMKSHLVLFGAVATVYRKELHLDKTYRQNETWLKTAMDFYVENCAGNKAFDHRIQSGFAYQIDLDPLSVSSAVNGALDAALQWILPALDKIQTLKDVLDYDRIGISVPRLPLSENRFAAPYTDFAIRFLLDDPLADLEQRNAEVIKSIEKENALYNHTAEFIASDLAHYQKSLEESRKTLHVFLTDKEIHRQTLEELAQRKIHNTELLINYGVI